MDTSTNELENKMKIYVYKNELLGENGDEFNDQSLIDVIECESTEECENKFNEKYGINDFCYSFCGHE